MQLAVPVCPNITPQPVHGMALQSSQKWPDTACRVEVLGARAEGAEAVQLPHTAWWIVQKANKRLGAETELGARLRNEY